MKEEFPDRSGSLTEPELSQNSATVTDGYVTALHTEPQEIWIHELRVGNAQAMISFFNLYYAPLCYFAERIIHDRQAAEDIVEDTLIKLWKKHTDFNTIQNIKAFLYITARNACLNYLKKYQRDLSSRKELAYLNGEAEDFVLNSIIRTEVLTEIYRQIEKLPPRSKKVLKMSVFENMRNHEIAAALEISIHTVKNQKLRAMQILKMKICKKNSEI